MTPVVLHHGIFNALTFRVGRVGISTFSGGIERAIKKRGHPVIVTRVHPTAGVVRRATQLKQTILRKLAAMGRPDDRVIIIAHSMGGLDARYMISCLDMADKVKALVTISTPHRGSAYADWCRGNLGQRLRAFKLARLLHIDIGALNDLTLDGCRTFNQAVPDSPQVRYFSVSGARPRKKIPAFARHSWGVINRIEGDNDGLVSVNSSIWGKHLGVWPVDHWHEVNKRFVIRNGVGNITPYYMRLLEEVETDEAESRNTGYTNANAVPA